MRTTKLLSLTIVLLALPLASCGDIYGEGGWGSRELEILWPRDNVTLRDEEVLRVRLRGRDLDDYDVYWYVDDSRERRMYNDWNGNPPAKFEIVDTWYWDWRGRGPYTVGFTAVDRRGRELAHRTVRVYVR